MINGWHLTSKDGRGRSKIDTICIDWNEVECRFFQGITGYEVDRLDFLEKDDPYGHRKILDYELSKYKGGSYTWKWEGFRSEIYLEEVTIEMDETDDTYKIVCVGHTFNVKSSVKR